MMATRRDVLCLDSLQLRMAPNRIHFLKFILEAYDGMAILSTIDRKQGLVELKYPSELQNDLRDLLVSMAEQVDIVCVPI